MNLDKLKNIAIFIIPFLTLCGAIYQITFWSVFNINGLAFLSISDIIQYSVYPFFASTIRLMISYLVGKFTFELMFNLSDYAPKPIPLKHLAISCTVILFLEISFESFPALKQYLSNSPVLITIIGFVAISLCERALVGIHYIIALIPNHTIRKLVLNILLYTLIFSFLGGILNANEIYNNKKFSYVKIKEQSFTDSTGYLKIINFAGNKLFLTDYHNSHIIVRDAGELDSLVIFYKN